MGPVEAFLASGQAALAVLLVVGVEAAILIIRQLRCTSYRAPPLAWISPLLAGAALVVCLLLVQMNAQPLYLGVALTVAGVAHLAGYRQRWFS